MEKVILAIDSGTTSVRAILFDRAGNMLRVSQREFQQLFPKSGWVEHDPEEIWSVQKFVIRDVLKKQGLKAADVAAAGITNQRETTVVWDKETGIPVYNAIVWQDRRTAGYCDQLKEKGFSETIAQKTGLLIDAYFSATKIRWILDTIPGAREQADKGKLAFGTIDTWLIWHMTHGKQHVTDFSNASRTLLFNIHTLRWDEELLKIFDIPVSMLPEVKENSGVIGYTVREHFGGEIPIAGMAGDQQAALFGQMCLEKGSVKNTYGTGCFAVMNTGETAIRSKHRLLSTIAWKINGKINYALEGSIFIGGAVVQWLRDQLHIIQTAAEIEEIARKVKDNGGVYFVPAFVGLGAPHWDSYAAGTIIGITRDTTDAHIARAALEAIAFQSMDVINTLAEDAGIDITTMKVDGGAAVNNLLMQIQANVLHKKVIRPKVIETTALGAAYLAGLGTGYWKNIDELKQQWQADKVFEPEKGNYGDIINNWHKAVERSKNWF